MTKDELRNLMRAKRRALSYYDVKISSESIAEKLYSLPCFAKADTIMVYLSAFKEPDTTALIEYIFSHNKKCVVPVSHTDTFTITPSYITSISDLQKGAYGILEPYSVDIADIKNIDIALIPGLAFDSSGNRTGFGKGYYDRFLSEFRGIKIGICYDFQIQQCIPTDAHDIKMNFIVTEKRIYNDF